MKQFEKLCNEYRENKRLIEELTAMNDELKAAILRIMDGKDVYTAGAAKATNKTVHSSRFDSTDFRKEYPALFDEYNRETEYKRFCVL